MEALEKSLLKLLRGATGSSGLRRDRLHQAEVIFQPVPQLGDKHILVFLLLAAFCGIGDRQKNVQHAVFRVHHAAGVEQHRAPADGRKILLHLVVDERPACRQHFQEEPPKFGPIPLAGANLEQGSADRFLAPDLKFFIEGAARVQHAKMAVEHEQRLGNGIDDVRRLDVGAAQQSV